MLNGKLLEMRTLCNIPEDDKQIKVTWYTWETTEGLPNKVQKSGTLGDVLNFLKTAATKFVYHCFVKKQQSGCFQAKTMLAKTDQETGAASRFSRKLHRCLPRRDPVSTLA